MASTELTIKIVSNVDDVIAQVDALRAYMEAAAPDDPIACEIAAFGEIDGKKHLRLDTNHDGERITCDVIVSPELQHILDLVPA